MPSWTQIILQILVFDRHTLPPNDPDAQAASANFTALVVHLCSLLHATCCQGLRRDPHLGNLKPHRSLTTKEPPMVGAPRARAFRGGQVEYDGRAGWAQCTDSISCELIACSSCA